ncbi:L-threonylcarbamoyladenylate synthase [Candidatus Solincola tengchongensis]|uniref:L-threonylcarbamoyladenylate synthase n=1 Tax=Candidatus Solincola tengchongensis TaxID=2900693 RepID=UPI002580A072|nr:L-threonylcarbamoyladenylate synthase [Candidatus Solincola tengchongensis]
MPEILCFDEHSLDVLFARCAESLARGGLAILPTETVYGLAARVDRREAVRRIFEVKGREAAKALPVMVEDAARAAELTAPEWREPLLRLSVFWPGPLTLVVKAAPLEWLEWVAPGSRKVGFRVPDHPFLLRLLRETGPLAVTSANLAGKEPPADSRDLDPLLVERVDLVLDQGRSGTGRPSTVAELTEGGLEIIRSGALSREELERALRSGGRRRRELRDA